MRPGAGRRIRIVVCDSDGGNQKEIYRTPIHAHEPAWSSDGRFVYFQGDRDVPPSPRRKSGASPPGAGPRSASSHARVSRCSPAPMPDGRGLLFSANPDSAELGLWWLPPSGRAPVRMTVGAGQYMRRSATSADGRVVAAALLDRRWPSSGFRSTAPRRPSARAAVRSEMPSLPSRRRRPSGLELRALRQSKPVDRGPNGSGARPLTTGNAIDETPAFSPDGQQIAFVSDRSGARAIWIVSRKGERPASSTAPRSSTRSLVPGRQGDPLLRPGRRGQGLYRLSVADRRVTRLPTPTGARAPAWNPRQPLIAYLIQEPASAEPRPRRNRIAFVDASGSPGSKAFARTRHLQRSPRVVPDGSRLLAPRAGPYLPQEIFLVSPRGRALSKRSSSSRRCRHPRRLVVGRRLLDRMAARGAEERHCSSLRRLRSLRPD